MSNAAVEITPDDIRGVIESFLDDLFDHVDSLRFDEVITKQDDLTRSELTANPESWTEEALIWEIIDTLGLNREPGRPASQRSSPDFKLSERDGDLEIIGENKSPNNIDQAEEELVEEYLSEITWPNNGIATDGFEWVVYRTEWGGDYPEFNDARRVDLRPVVKAIAREQNRSELGDIEDIDIEERLQEFIDIFAPKNLAHIILQEAPREFRDTRQRDVEAFYELFIELLFGDINTHGYSTCLLDDIVSPNDATEEEERLFAINLMNRLLFIKFLETRDVLPDRFLQQRVTHYEENKDVLAGNLYESQIRPLFFKLFNTPENEREAKYRSGWFADVPYLNGGLFRENIRNESQYTVQDRTLPTIIADLIEESNLELEGRSFDPAILGSVFEKTINHISSESGAQKDVGAYYTPSDVTRLVTRDTVEPKVKDEIIEAFIEHTDDEDKDYIHRRMQSESLGDILHYIENAESIYGADPEAVKNALERINNLKILDPACGSGHFLTSVMGQLHQAQMSLLRGLNGGDDPSEKRQYNAKKNLALNAIFGVDVDPIAVEIAKLRIWLKIVEGNNWESGYGRLPNIDVNILAGNSLVGFPVVGNVQTSLESRDDRLETLTEMRKQYKQENEGSRPKIIELENEIRDDRDDYFLETLNYTVPVEIEEPEEYDELIDIVPEGELHPIVESIQVRREDGESFTDDEDESLDNLGFRTYSKSARITIEDAIDIDFAKTDNENAFLQKLDDLRDNGIAVVEVVRQPMSMDLERTTGESLHWDIEFPELTASNNGDHAAYDVIIGNPPYGDILNKHEKLFTDPYETGNIPDISAQFVERQLQLLAEDGYYGNVTTLRLVYQSSIEEIHDLIRSSLEETQISSFGTRPSRLFDNADIKVAIITGQKHTDSQDDDTDDEVGSIFTSDLIMFSDENRQEVLNSIDHANADGFVLRDKIGGNDGNRAILPKIGTEEKREILEKLKDLSTEDHDEDGDCSDDDDNDDQVRVFSEVYDRGSEASGYEVWRREGVRYWTNVMREKLYDAREVKAMYFDEELDQNTAFLVLNSSLFYAYWLTYGNSHHLNWTQIGAFPFPPESKVDEKSDRITELADELWEAMENCFDPTMGVTGEFDMGVNKSIVNEVDDLIGELYGLTDDEVEYLKDYPPNYGGSYGRVVSEEDADQQELETTADD
jgi:hypothetical protein